MKYSTLLSIIFFLQFISCNKKSQQTEQTIIAKKNSGDSISVRKYQPTLYPEMIEVEGGSFWFLGREVELSTFHIGKYEVTISQFKQFVDETSYLTQAERDVISQIYMTDKLPNWRTYNNLKVISDSLYCLPVTHISYDDALAYCDWLSKKLGKKYTLPSEAQWEYVAKGGNKSKGYVYIGSNKAEEVMELGKPLTCVGMFLPNELSIYNMAGSVQEWCLDEVGRENKKQTKNPVKTRPNGFKEQVSQKVVRGGKAFSDEREKGEPTYNNGYSTQNVPKKDLGLG